MNNQQLLRPAGRRNARKHLINCLQQGVRPSPRHLDWPSRPVVFELFRWLNHHPQIERWCRGSEENSTETAKFLASIERCFRAKKKRLEGTDLDPAGDADEPLSVNAETQPHLAEKRSPWSVRISGLVHGFSSHWPEMSERQLARKCFQSKGGQLEQRLGELQEVAALITQLGFEPAGWDLSTAEKYRKEIGQVVSLANQLLKEQKIKKILEELGRLQEINDACPSAKVSQTFENIFERRRVRRQVLQPGIPFETSGIELSDNIELMLPDEAVLLADPDLEILWYARFAEGQLSTYAVQGTDISERSEKRPRARPKSQQRSGPVIALVDTSGSMLGRPEHIAKAVVLGLCQLAFRQRRRVFVINFSGVGNIETHELTFDINGLIKLLKFLKESFGGGTDINSPLRSALDRIAQDAEWAQADILIASDGEFPVSDDVLNRLKSAKSSDSLRLTGVLIGKRCQPMLSLCGKDRFYDFKKWEGITDDRW